MNEKIKRIVYGTIAVFLAMTMLSTTGIHAEDAVIQSDDTSVTLQGNLTIENRGFKNDEQLSIRVVNEAGEEVGADVVHKNKTNFAIALNLKKGETYNYRIQSNAVAGQNAVKGVQHQVKKVQIKVDQAGVASVAVYDEASKLYIPAVMNGNIANLNKTTGGTIFFRLPYRVTYEFWLQNKVRIVGRDWIKGEVYSFTVNYQFEDGAVKTKEHTIKTTELAKFKHALLPFQGEFTMPQKGYVIMKFQIRQGETQPNSLLKDNVVNETYVKMKDNGDGTAQILYSRDGGKKYYYAPTDDKGRINVLTKDEYTLTYFTGNALLTTTLQGEAFQGDDEASYELYRYQTGDASLDNTDKALIGTYVTKKGKLTVNSLEEGTYFFVQTKAPKGYQENHQVYAFEITKENYQTTASITVNNVMTPLTPVEPDNEGDTTKPSEPEEKPEVSKPEEHKGVVTADNTMLYGYVMLLVASLCLAGVVVIKKKQTM